MYGVYIGSCNGEEFYIDRNSNIDAWSLCGFDVRTEEDLRDRARETTPEDLGYETKGIEQWFDYDKFADDMEENWYESNDIQGEYEKDGVTQHLCFQSGQSLINYFIENGIKTYEDYTDHFDEGQGLNKKQLETLLKLINMYMLDARWNKEAFNEWADTCKEYPTEGEEDENNDN